MSVERFKNDLICKLLVIAHRYAPLELVQTLKRAQFKAGDIGYRRVKSNHDKVWVTVNRWPWEPRITCLGCENTLPRDCDDLICSSCHAIARDRGEAAP